MLACQKGVQPLPEAQFREMINFEIAEKIAVNCDDRALNVSRVDVHKMIDYQLRISGMEPREIASKKRQAFAVFGKKYMEFYANVVPVSRNDPKYYCKYGDYEIDRHSAVGLLLT